MDPGKACNKHTGPPFPLASPKTEMYTPTELAVTAGRDNILKAKKLLVSKEGMQYIPGSLKHDLWLMKSHLEALR